MFEDLGIVPVSHMDNFKSDFMDLLDEASTRDTFISFDPKKGHRLEHFYSVCHDKFQTVWPVIKMFVLSNGQGSVGKGFSSNKQSNDVNLQKESLVARRVIKDHMFSIGVGVEHLSVTPELLSECRDAYRRFQDSLRFKKILKADSEKAVKRKSVQDEVRVLKRITSEIEDVKKDLQNDCDSSMKNAEKERNKDAKISLFSNAAKLRDSVISKEDELQKVEKTLPEKEIIRSKRSACK